MKQLKETIKQILIEIPATRNSRMLLNWEVLRKKGFIYKGISGDEYLSISKDAFMKNNSESVRRCSQALQRTDLLSGAKIIQPNENIKNTRVKMAKSKGYEYQQGKAVYNPITCTYEIY